MYGSSPIEVVARNAMVQGLIFCDQFDYTARFLTGTPTAIAANGSQTVPVQVDVAFDFVIQQYLGTLYDANLSLNAAPNFLIRFQKDSSAKYMSNSQIHWLNMFGDFAANKIPNSLPFPVFLPGKTTYNVELQNLTADAPSRVEIVLRGFAIYYNGDEPRETLRERIFKRSFS